MAAKKQQRPIAGGERKSVLGNDPFKRGAAPRPMRSDAPPPSKKQGRPATPELQSPHANAARGPSKAVPANRSRTVDPQAHAGTPSAVPLGSAPRPHAGTPSAVPLGSAPRAHPASPSVSVDPHPHAGTPLAADLDGPTAHAASPGLAFDPRPHAAAPVAAPLNGPRAHPGSPTVRVDPRPHAGAPVAQALDRGPTAHASSPMSADPEPHAASPSIDHEPVAHPDAPTTEAAPTERADAPTSLFGAFRGMARAVRSAVGLSSRATEVDAFGKDADLTAALKPLADLLYERYWRVQTSGIEHVPLGACVLVANHAGALPLDGPVLHLALKRERPELTSSRWLLEDQVFHAPFLGVLANRLGAVRASPDNAHRLLDQGRPLIVFPEGFHGLSKPFAERYQLKRFGRGGYLKIALRARVPVIPVAIIGGEESMPLLGKLPGKLFGVDYIPLTLPPLPAKWHLSFGEPIDLTGAPSDPEADLAWIERKNGEVRDRIESMLKDQLATRGGAF
jgi:1-acyl-sn-glycerol-3-phosphate acyltransferase